MRANRNLDLGAVVARVTSFSARRATLVVAVATLLSIAGVVLALMLDPGTDASAAGDGGGEAAAATEELRGRFGGDPIVVLIRGRLTGMLLTEDVARMLSLEGCISGNVPRDAKPAAPVCSDLAKRKPVQVVYGPGTFINEAAGQILDRINFDRAGEAAAADRAAREARRAARGRGLSEAQQEQFAQEARRIVTATYAQRALELAVRFGLSSVPALNNPEFVLQLVFEPSLGAEVPKPRFAYLFPHPRRGGDPGSAAPGAERRGAPGRGGDGPPGGGGKALRPEVRQLRGVGIPGRLGGGGGRALGLRAGARGGSDPAGGARARPDVPGLARDAAACVGSRRDGDHARRPVAAGRVVLRGGRGRDAAAVRPGSRVGASAARAVRCGAGSSRPGRLSRRSHSRCS